MYDNLTSLTKFILIFAVVVWTVNIALIAILFFNYSSWWL